MQLKKSFRHHVFHWFFQIKLGSLIILTCRFSLQLDIAAPKVIIPSDFYPDGKQQSKLLLDLGHLTLQTEVDIYSY